MPGDAGTPLDRPAQVYRGDRDRMTTVLSATRLSKAFGAIHVADRVTFSIDEGEILGVIGPNGAGKTSLFGLISGNIRPDSGYVEFGGNDITRWAPQDRARAGIARTY